MFSQCDAKGQLDGFSITASACRKAAVFFYNVRTTTRRQLGQFSKFNSALLGLLKDMFENMVHIQKTVRGILRLTLKGVRFFFSGMARAADYDWELIKSQKAKFVLASYAHIREGTPEIFFEKLRQYDYKCLIDSGAFSLHQQRLKLKEKGLLKESETLKDIKLEEYARFINTHKNEPYFYHFFNLDVIGKGEETRKNQTKLEVLTGIRPIPVWQPLSGLEELERIVGEDHELIAIGGTCVKDSPWNSIKKQRELFNQVFSQFPDQPFHWLGGSNHLLFEFSFFSSDSTSWFSPRRWGERKIFSKGWKPAPDNWSIEEIMAYNIHELAHLKYDYERISQIQMDDFFPLNVPKKRVRTSKTIYDGQIAFNF